MRTKRLAAPLALLLATGGALAHEAELIAAQAGRTRPGAPDVQARLTMTAGTLGLLLSNGADSEGPRAQEDLTARHPAIALRVWDAAPIGTPQGRCARTAHQAQLHEGRVVLTATFHCPPGPLWQTFGLLSALPAAYQVVLSRPGEGPAESRFVDARQPHVRLPGEGDTAPGLSGWVGLGVKHILSGADHLAFLVALLLGGGTLRRLLVLVTSFTVAHSLTLGAVTLGLLPLGEQGERWAEIAIALSLIYVAGENFLVRTPRHRPALTFGFGLVHGLGFASVLKGYGLGEAVVQGLLGFNLGVELGQALIVLPLVPLLRLSQRRPAVHRWTMRVLSSAVLLMGINWLIKRVG
ncbi:HupE / UreJ protein [Stigmatella aurantiaca]|uniref:HupE / UreJ protein n=1 Tax=Stigmatella aurantiaca TaxID=41 RepID=A0A1H7W216_STIAU|nr:HupE/UreJ family protein [Stigmatella aurantiaca]SEM15523.1 HupE / UreJ protein [Stigmatella aurantiaca]